MSNTAPQTARFKVTALSPNGGQYFGRAFRPSFKRVETFVTASTHKEAVKLGKVALAEHAPLTKLDSICIGY